MRARKHKNCLIGIRQQDLLILTLGPRVEPDDGLLPFFDLFYHPTSILQDSDPNLIPKSGDVAGGASLFQLAAQLTNNNVRVESTPVRDGKALPGFNSKETRLGFDDQTL